MQILLASGEVSVTTLDFLLRSPGQTGVTSPVGFLAHQAWGGIKVSRKGPLKKVKFSALGVSPLTLVPMKSARRSLGVKHGCVPSPGPPQQSSPFPGLLGRLSVEQVHAGSGLCPQDVGRQEDPGASLPQPSCLSPAGTEGWTAPPWGPQAVWGCSNRAPRNQTPARALFRHIHAGPNSVGDASQAGIPTGS